jgi:PAP2 superfamily
VRPSLRTELAIGLGTYAAYLAVRALVWSERGRVRARRNAERVMVIERGLGLDLEARVQRAALRSPRLLHAANVGYGAMNVTLTVGWLVHLYSRGDPSYRALRRTAVAVHLAAQPVFLLFPTAPPRVLDGYVDTLADVSGIDLEHPLLVRFYNPIAALPSLHVAFAVVTGHALARRAHGTAGKLAARAYAPLVGLVVVATGNHYVADVAAGAALGVAARRLAG